jgi:alkylation response protein AidB-like acyl-CoA dehydrogenase
MQVCNVRVSNIYLLPFWQSSLVISSFVARGNGLALDVHRARAGNMIIKMGPSTFRQAILDLVPEVRKRADAAERERSLPAETIASLREAGLFRAFVPRVHGGDQRKLLEVFDAMTDLAVGCASTAWVGSLVAIHNIAACWLDRAGQNEIFAEGPDVLIASSVAPTGTLVLADGGLRLGGRWRFSSGVDHASWIMLGANIRTGVASPPVDYFLTFVRASEVMLIDDWQVSGLRATGSKSLELKDVFVPNRRALLLRTVAEGTAAGLSLHEQPFYRLPWNPLFISAFPPAALGIALAMMDGFREYTASRVSSYSGRMFRTNAGSAMRMAEAAARIDAARLVFRRDVAALDRCAQEGGALSTATLERIPYNVPFVVDACSRAVLELFRGSGGRALHESNPFQRYFRDVHAMTQHAAMDTDAAGETYGRALFLNPALSFGARE